MRAFVGVTDRDWYRFLSRRPGLDEVNFWRPSGRSFRALQRGEPFLFKLKAPDNAIAGGGFFEHASILPCGLAWDTFDVGNGGASYEEMVDLIAPLRSGPVTRTTPIGCIILRDPFFWPRDQWISPPRGFPSNIPGMGYDLLTSPGAEMWEQVVHRLQAAPETSRFWESPGAIYGDPVLIAPRMRQRAFKIVIADVYQRRCAVTREKAFPTLEAAHVIPVSKGGHHRVDNGLLLRSDVHTLFDDGYLTVMPDLTFRVSSKLKDDFDDGETYRDFDSKPIWRPSSAEQRPNPEFLEWHNDMVFLK